MSKQPLLPILLAVALAGFAGSAAAKESAVIVGNGPDQPVPVTGTVHVVSPVHTSFVEEKGFAIDAGETSERVPLLEVPAGRRAIVEQVSVRCYSPAVNPTVEAYVSVAIAVPNGIRSARFHVPLSYQGTTSLNGPTYAGSLATRLYADRGGVIAGGIGVNGHVLRANAQGSSGCVFSISGHTVAL